MNWNFVAPFKFKFSSFHSHPLDDVASVVHVSNNDTSDIVSEVEYVIDRIGYNKGVGYFLFRANDNTINSSNSN